MGRPQKGKTIHIGGQFDINLSVGLQKLAEANGISMREALRRSIIRTIQEGRIPGISDMEEREHEKYGAATPTPSYDGVERPETPQSGRKGSGRPGETIAP